MVKRLFDLTLVLASVVIWLPTICCLAFLVAINLGRPVFFRQQRPGLGGQPFELIKFRTMTNACDEEGSLLDDSQRLTRFGSFLRKTSFDELPELVNVLKGEMSLVGPRPLLMEYLPLYTPEQSRRHEVRPGITGWAQINGRNTLNWQERFKLDVWYVDHHSVWLDLRILFLTFFKVLKRDGISQQGHATMTKFTGATSYDKEE